MSNPYAKPVPEYSVYKHLMMLVNHLEYESYSDKVAARKKVRDTIAAKLKAIAESRAMTALQYYGE